MIDLTHSNGIYMPHLSPSTITSFIEYRSNWFNSKVKRKPFQANPNMARGTAVEHAINEWIGGLSTDKMYDSAQQKYLNEIEPWIKLQKHYDKDDDELYASLGGLVDAAHAHYDLNFDTPPLMQSKVAVKLDGVKREIKGYMDYHIPNQMVRDCKVTARTPSKLKQAYIIQGSIYKKHTGLPMVFDFIVANKKPTVKTITLTDEDYSFGIRYATRAAQILEELEECSSPARVLELMAFPNLEQFFNPIDRREAARQWGIL